MVLYKYKGDVKLYLEHIILRPFIIMLIDL